MATHECERHSRAKAGQRQGMATERRLHILHLLLLVVSALFPLARSQATITLNGPQAPVVDGTDIGPFTITIDNIAAAATVTVDFGNADPSQLTQPCANLGPVPLTGGIGPEDVTGVSCVYYLKASQSTSTYTMTVTVADGADDGTVVPTTTGSFTITVINDPAEATFAIGLAVDPVTFDALPLPIAADAAGIFTGRAVQLQVTTFYGPVNPLAESLTLMISMCRLENGTELFNCAPVFLTPTPSTDFVNTYTDVIRYVYAAAQVPPDGLKYQPMVTLLDADGATIAEQTRGTGFSEEPFPVALPPYFTSLTRDWPTYEGENLRVYYRVDNTDPSAAAVVVARWPSWAVPICGAISTSAPIPLATNMTDDGVLECGPIPAPQSGGVTVEIQSTINVPTIFQSRPISVLVVNDRRVGPRITLLNTVGNLRLPDTGGAPVQVIMELVIIHNKPQSVDSLTAQINFDGGQWQPITLPSPPTLVDGIYTYSVPAIPGPVYWVPGTHNVTVVVWDEETSFNAPSDIATRTFTVFRVTPIPPPPPPPPPPFPASPPPPSPPFFLWVDSPPPPPSPPPSANAPPPPFFTIIPDPSPSPPPPPSPPPSPPPPPPPPSPPPPPLTVPPPPTTIVIVNVAKPSPSNANGGFRRRRAKAPPPPPPSPPPVDPNRILFAKVADMPPNGASSRRLQIMTNRSVVWTYNTDIDKWLSSPPNSPVRAIYGPGCGAKCGVCDSAWYPAVQASNSPNELRVFFDEPLQIRRILISEVNAPGVVKVDLIPWPAGFADNVNTLPRVNVLSQTQDKTKCGGWLNVAVSNEVSGINQAVPPSGTQFTLPQLGVKAYGGIFITVKESSTRTDATHIDGVRVSGRVIYPRKDRKYYRKFTPVAIAGDNGKRSAPLDEEDQMVTVADQLSAIRQGLWSPISVPAAGGSGSGYFGRTSVGQM